MWFFDFIKLCESSPLQISYAVFKATPDLAVLFESYVARTLLEIGDIFTKDEEFIPTRVTTRDLHSQPRRGLMKEGNVVSLKVFHGISFQRILGLK